MLEGVLSGTNGDITPSEVFKDSKALKEGGVKDTSGVETANKVFGGVAKDIGAVLKF